MREFSNFLSFEGNLSKLSDKNSQTFFEENFSEDSVVGLDEEFYLISEKIFKMEVDKIIEPLKTWMIVLEQIAPVDMQVMFYFPAGAWCFREKIQ